MLLQEITTTATLLHPQILPMFDGGKPDGVPFHMTPFLDGDSFRATPDRATPDRATPLGADDAVLEGADWKAQSYTDQGAARTRVSLTCAS